MCVLGFSKRIHQREQSRPKRLALLPGGKNANSAADSSPDMQNTSASLSKKLHIAKGNAFDKTTNVAAGMSEMYSHGTHIYFTFSVEKQVTKMLQNTFRFDLVFQLGKHQTNKVTTMCFKNIHNSEKP